MNTTHPTEPLHVEGNVKIRRNPKPGERVDGEVTERPYTTIIEDDNCRQRIGLFADGVKVGRGKDISVSREQFEALEVRATIKTGADLLKAIDDAFQAAKEIEPEDEPE